MRRVWAIAAALLAVAVIAILATHAKRAQAAPSYDQLSVYIVGAPGEGMNSTVSNITILHFTFGANTSEVSMVYYAPAATIYNPLSIDILPAPPLSLLKKGNLYIGNNYIIITYNISSEYIGDFLNKSIYYYIIALARSGRTLYLGYAEVPGKELSGVLDGGAGGLYRWVVDHVELKPLDQYPVSRMQVVVKIEDGDLANGGVACARPVPNLIATIPNSLPYECAYVVDGVVEFWLPSIPYVISYVKATIGEIPSRFPIRNVTSYPVLNDAVEIVESDTPFTDLARGAAVAVPSNNTVAVVAQRMYNRASYVFALNIIAANIGVQANHTTSSEGASTQGGGAPPRGPTTYLLVAVMLSVAVAAGVAASVAATRLIHRRATA